MQKPKGKHRLGGGYAFAGDYNSKGCYTYSSGSEYFGNAYFAQAESTTLDSTDECDPTGVTTISGAIYYNGYTITVIDPNA